MSEDILLEDYSENTDDPLIEASDDLENMDDNILSEFKLVSILVNKIMLDSIKDHKKRNLKSISKRRKEKKRRRHRQKELDHRGYGGEMIPYPRVG